MFLFLFLVFEKNKDWSPVLISSYRLPNTAVTGFMFQSFAFRVSLQLATCNLKQFHD
jgi:hypothetical protein